MEEKKDVISRRVFLQGATASTLVFALAANARGAEGGAAAGPPVGCGIIGMGDQGRLIAAQLTQLKGAALKAICDNYPAQLKKASGDAPGAALCDDYRKLLETKGVDAVFVATPSHQHKEIVLAALQAGKHVYCESPMAVTVEEAKAIALAGKGAKTVFQVGQQFRANPLYEHAMKFVKIGALGNLAQATAHWHHKESWRRPASNAERAKNLNWRLYKETSAGLVGEVGIHQIDVITWAIRKLPVSVQGFGSIQQWKQDDDRTVADTIQCVIEYPRGVRLSYDATLANSCDGMVQRLQGSDAAIILRADHAWMVKEADAPMLGWEGYAHTEKVGEDTGVVLIANASKQLTLGKTKLEVEKLKDPVYYACDEFLASIREKKEPACGALEGYQAAVVAIKANEAIVTGNKVTFQKEWFDLA